MGCFTKLTSSTTGPETSGWMENWYVVVVSKHGNVTKNITKQEHVVKNYRLHIDFLIVT